MAPSVKMTSRQGELSNRLLATFLAEGFADLTIDAIAGRMRCSKTTLYALAESREQLVTSVVRHFFREATVRVEARLAEAVGARARISAYFLAVAAELGRASQDFIEDVDAFPPTREVYERNTRLAAARVQSLIAEGVDEGIFRPVHGAFVADVIATVMVRIQSRRMAGATGLDDAQAYEELAELVLRGVAAPG